MFFHNNEILQSFSSLQHAATQHMSLLFIASIFCPLVVTIHRWALARAFITLVFLLLFVDFTLSRWGIHSLPPFLLPAAFTLEYLGIYAWSKKATATLRRQHFLHKGFPFEFTTNTFKASKAPIFYEKNKCDENIYSYCKKGADRRRNAIPISSFA